MPETDNKPGVGVCSICSILISFKSWEYVKACPKCGERVKKTVGN